MLTKKTLHTIKLQIKGGSANPGPPVGPKLGSKGLKAMDFCTQFNAQTQDKKEDLLSVTILVYEDKTFSFTIHSPTTVSLIKKAAGIDKGAAEPNRNEVASITQEQLKKIAIIKQQDAGARTLEVTMKTVKGTAQSMGVRVAG